MDTILALNENNNIEQYNIELAEAEAEFKKGNFISNEAMLEEIKTWQME
jgi:hypothetical protein